MTTTHQVHRISGASWAIDARHIETGDTLVQTSPIGTSTYRIIGEPMTTGYRQGFVRVAEVGGFSDGNEFGMHYDHA